MTELDLRTMLHEELESRQKARIERAEECLRQAVTDAIPRALDLMEGRETTQQVVNANPVQSTNGHNGSHEPQQQPTAQQGKPNPYIEIAARELASAEEVDVQALGHKAQEIADFKGRNPEQVGDEIAARVQELRDEADTSGANNGSGNRRRIFDQVRQRFAAEPRSE